MLIFKRLKRLFSCPFQSVDSSVSWNFHSFLDQGIMIKQFNEKQTDFAKLSRSLTALIPLPSDSNNFSWSLISFPFFMTTAFILGEA